MTGTKSQDRYAIFFAASAALMMIGHMQGGKTVRDALFLSYFSATDLPKMMVATAVLSVLAIVTYSRVLAKYGPARLTPPLYIFSGLVSIGEWMAMSLWPDIVTIVLYLHVTVLDSLLVSGFWSIMNERYDPYSAKKVISRLAIFATMGGLLGAGAASVIAKIIDIRAVIAMLAVLHLFSGLALYQVSRGQDGGKGLPAARKSLLTIVKKNTLIQRMAILMVTLAATIALLDYLFKATLQVTLSKDALVTFFAYFYIAIDIGSLLLQTFVGSKALRWFGLGGTIIVLPLGIIFGGLITFVFRSLTTITLLRGASNLLTNSFFGPGYELLFTPISPADKRTSKILIDVGANRAGNMLGGLMIMGLLLVPGTTGSYILLTAMILAGAMSLLIFLLNQGYVSQLAKNLSSGVLRVNEIEIKDKTTAGTIATTQTTLERDMLLQEISLYRSGSIPTKGQIAPGKNAGLSPHIPADGTDEDAEIRAIQDLRSQDEKRIRHVLVNKTATPAMLPHILPLLRRQSLLQEALHATKPMVSAASGQLVDALLDRHQHPLIRRRIPLLLGQADNERAVQGLIFGLQDREMDVRFRCAEALARIKTNYPQLTVDTEAIWGVVHRELSYFSSSGFKSTQGVEPLRYLFILFGIIFGLKLMNICYESLQAEDQTIRGTALEYLDNQLPQNVRATLWPIIASGHPKPKSDRTLQEIMDDLLQAGRLLKSKEQILELRMKDLKIVE